METGRLCLINTNSLGHGGKQPYTEGQKDLLRLGFIISQPVQMHCRNLLSPQCPQPQLQSPLDTGHKNSSVSAYTYRTDDLDRRYYNRRKKNSVWCFHFFFSFSAFLLCCSIFSSVITFKVL